MTALCSHTIWNFLIKVATIFWKIIWIGQFLLWCCSASAMSFVIFKNGTLYIFFNFFISYRKLISKKETKNRSLTNLFKKRLDLTTWVHKFGVTDDLQIVIPIVLNSFPQYQWTIAAPCFVFWKMLVHDNLIQFLIIQYCYVCWCKPNFLDVVN